MGANLRFSSLFNRAITSCFLVSALCGCPAKQVVPIEITQPGDNRLSCYELQSLISKNNIEIIRLLGEDKVVENGNVTKVVASGIVPFAGLLILASSDLSNEEQVKARALQDRNEYLGLLATQKGCN